MRNTLVFTLIALAACSRSKVQEPSPELRQRRAQRHLQRPFLCHRARRDQRSIISWRSVTCTAISMRLAVRFVSRAPSTTKMRGPGGTLTIVQTGDEIDRGDDDRKILDLFERLKTDAKKAGGEVIALAGNHELMNAAFDFRYVTPGGFAAFSDLHLPAAPPLAIHEIDSTQWGRAAAFMPGGPYATKIAERPVIVKIGANIFTHGGVLPKHVKYGLDRIKRRHTRFSARQKK